MRPAVAALAALTVLTVAGCTHVGVHADDDPAAIVERWQTRSGAPAVVVAIDGPDLDDELVAAGTASRGGRPVTGDDRFRVASITKMLVATVVLQLVDEGRIGLDDPVQRYLPVLELAADVTVRQLLNHTSGIPDYAAVPGLGTELLEDRDRVWTTDEILGTITGFPPQFAPGTEYGYSNTDYILLGLIIETVTGRDWAHELRGRIIERLALADTTIPSHGEPPGSVVPGYFDVDNDGGTEDVEDGPWPSLETSEGPAGAIVSTASDIARATRAVFDGTLLPGHLVEEMTAPGPHDRRYDGYGLGVELARPDRTTLVVGHGGFLPGFRTVTWYVPAQDTVVTVLTNESRVDPTDLAELLIRARHEVGGSVRASYPLTDQSSRSAPRSGAPMSPVAGVPSARP